MSLFAQTDSILMFEWADHSGKTTIAKRIAEKMKIPYFKDNSWQIEKDFLSRQWDSEYTLENHAVNFIAPILFMNQIPLAYTESWIVFDRALASAYVYWTVLREQDDYFTQRILDVDEFCWKNSRFVQIIFHPNVERAKESCRNSDVSNAPIWIDCPDSLVAIHYDEINEWYRKFESITKVKTLVFEEDMEVWIKWNIIWDLWTKEQVQHFYQLLAKAQKKPHESKHEFYSFEKYQLVLEQIICDFVHYI